MTSITRVPACSVSFCPVPRDPDFHLCIACQKPAVHHHHVRHKGMGGSKEDSPIVCLCVYHHDGVHTGGYKDEIEDGWYVIRNREGQIVIKKRLEAGSAAAEEQMPAPRLDVAARPNPSAAAPSASGESGTAGVLRKELLPGSSTSVVPPSLEAWCQHGMKWVYLGLTIRAGIDDWRFAVGDWFNDGEGFLGEQAYGYLRPFKEETVRQYAWVAGTVARSTRVLELPWTDHRAVAALPPGEQAEWLEKALRGGLTSKELNRAIHGEKPKVRRWTIEELREQFGIYITIDVYGGTPDVLEFLDYLEAK